MIKEALANHDIAAIREFQRTVRKPDLSHIPGKTGLPILGDTYAVMTKLHDYLDRKYAKYGPVFRFRIPGVEAVVMLGPEANRLVFQNEKKQFSNFLAWDFLFRNLFDNNLLERDFASHKRTRKAIQLAFKREAIEGHIEIMNPIMQRSLANWETGRPIKAMEHVKSLLLDLGANVFLGIQIGEESDKLNQAFVDIVNGTADPFKRKELFFSPFAKGVKGRKILSQFVFDNIDERRRKEGRDIFSQLCHLEDEHGNLFSDEAVRDQIIFVLFAAHDTTTSALSAVLYELASDNAWQETLREEIRGLEKSELTFEDLEKLEKTGWTFKEALRMYPALSGMPRYALEGFEFKGYQIPDNTPVLVFPLFSHYMEEYWTEPYKFDPKRFSPEREEHKKDFFQYAPFGGGAHKCLGLHFAETQAKMFLFHLLRNYRVSKDTSMTRYKYNNAPLTFPTDGLPLTFTRL